MSALLRSATAAAAPAASTSRPGRALTTAPHRQAHGRQQPPPVQQAFSRPGPRQLARRLAAAAAGEGEGEEAWMEHCSGHAQARDGFDGCTPALA